MQDDGVALYTRFLQGDMRALETLISLYRRSLLRFIYGYVRDEFLAEDILEDTFAELYFKRGFRDTGKASLKTYLYTIARNKSLNAVRKRKRQREISLHALPRDAEYFLCGADAEENAEQAKRKQTVHAAIDKLKEDYREVLLLRFFDGLSPERIAQITRRKPKQVYNLLARGKTALKEILTVEGFRYENL